MNLWRFFDNSLSDLFHSDRKPPSEQCFSRSLFGYTDKISIISGAESTLGACIIEGPIP